MSTSSAAPSPRALSSGPSAKQASRWIASGATLTIFGLTLCLTENRDVGGSLALMGLALSLLGLHRFGRAGRRSLV